MGADTSQPEQSRQGAEWERGRALVGGNIRRLRIQKGMTQEDLALRSGVTHNVLVDVEHGRRGLLYERLFDIAGALQVDVFDRTTKT